MNLQGGGKSGTFHSKGRQRLVTTRAFAAFQRGGHT